MRGLHPTDTRLLPVRGLITAPKCPATGGCQWMRHLLSRAVASVRRAGRSVHSSRAAIIVPASGCVRPSATTCSCCRQLPPAVGRGRALLLVQDAETHLWQTIGGAVEPD